MFGNTAQVSSGRDTIILVRPDNSIFTLQNVSVDAAGNLQYDLLQLDGELTNVSVHRGVAWGVGPYIQSGSNYEIWKADVAAAISGAREAGGPGYSWTEIDNDVGITQIEVGEFGVFGTTDDREIYYRVGTHNNNGSEGSSWQLLSGGLNQITSGLHTAYGVNASNEVWQINANAFNEATSEFDLDGLWIRFDGRTGTNISAL